MKRASQILEFKGFDIWSVSPDTSVYDALEDMAQKNVGAMVVLDGEELAGMFSERDYARKVMLVGKTSMKTLVREVMTEDVVKVKSEHTIAECMMLMTENHVRHLPVCRGKNVIGVISIGDVVKATIDELDFTVDQLENYIAGSG